MGSWDGAQCTLCVLWALGRMNLPSEILADHLILQMGKLLREGRQLTQSHTACRVGISLTPGLFSLVPL